MAGKRKAEDVLFDRHGREPEADDGVEIISGEEFAATKAEPRARIDTSGISIHALDITRYIDFQLDVAAGNGNYTKWRDSFVFVLTEFNARDHVEAETYPLHADEEWRATDDTIVLWIYTTISDELHDVVASADSTAYTAWHHLIHFVTENMAARALHLGNEFRATVQGDIMSVVDYCGKLKGIADQLADVREPVSDKALTMQLIQGLDGRFKDQKELLESMVPFPSFVQAQSRLKIAEIKLKPNPQILHEFKRQRSGSSGDRRKNGYDQQPHGHFF